MVGSNSKKQKNSSKPIARRFSSWLILVLLLFVVGLVVGQWQTTQKEEIVAPSQDSSAQAVRDVLLYFATPDGQTLVAENSTIAECEQEEHCLQDTVRALISGPKGDLSPVLPPQTSLLGVVVDGSVITLDFSKELVAAHPGGTQSELITIYALVDTLTTNFPHLRQLRVLIEGAPAETLKGHVDLRHPIYPDFSFVEEGDAPIGNVNSLPAGGGQ